MGSIRPGRGRGTESKRECTANIFKASLPSTHLQGYFKLKLIFILVQFAASANAKQCNESKQ